MQSFKSTDCTLLTGYVSLAFRNILRLACFGLSRWWSRNLLAPKYDASLRPCGLLLCLKTVSGFHLLFFRWWVVLSLILCEVTKCRGPSHVKMDFDHRTCMTLIFWLEMHISNLCHAANSSNMFSSIPLAKLQLQLVNSKSFVGHGYQKRQVMDDWEGIVGNEWEEKFTRWGLIIPVWIWNFTNCSNRTIRKRGGYHGSKALSCAAFSRSL